MLQAQIKQATEVSSPFLAGLGSWAALFFFFFVFVFSREFHLEKIASYKQYKIVRMVQTDLPF